MAGELNTWWVGDPDEIYWMEITNRDDLGDDLHAPKVDDAGRAYWSYNLIREVQDGDVVLHWHKDLMGDPGLVGWSEATGAVEDSTIVWQARGTAGRAHGPTGVEPAWRMPLTDYTPLLEPVFLDGLRSRETELRAAHDQLLAQQPQVTYLPFAFSDKRPVRAAQGYLVKFPRAYLVAFPELASLPTPDGRGRDERAPRAGARPGESGYHSDPRVRRALERHAVDRAISYFEQLGYDVFDVGATHPFDLLVASADEERRVEVKGSSATATTVELTAGEVRSAGEANNTDLFIVDGIVWWREADGSVTTDGGTERVLHDWVPAEADLTVTRYRYAVPEVW